ncbi:SbcC/MukB-like Walker B domain-containing protein [Beduini massiliensis]|uniref:SbcC/MukB-like Walker B domain-containing protein n=1 Tax=Beduini massiliensis TaxID=1585974 RepID=UPI00059AACCE|nr:SbcC/MukB-like Walker B domain-containing protein [Beduini massiliensis]
MKILKRVQLVNWSYISYRLLSFSEHVNFFTGPSGSGKSTVLDALQVVLLGDTNGKRIFNKAAKKESNRELIEYLRGMQTENTEKQYLRNQDFVSQIVLEFEDDISHIVFCLGIVFDVKVNNPNEAEEEHHFFFYNHPLSDHYFCTQNDEMRYPWSIRDFIHESKIDKKLIIYPNKKQYQDAFLSRHMGELNYKYFDLFKKAIAFNVDMGIDQFIRQFVCQEDHINLDKMLNSFRDYNKMLRIIKTTKEEKVLLEKIENSYYEYKQAEYQISKYKYYLNRIEIALIRQKYHNKLYSKEECYKKIQIIEHDIEEIEKRKIVANSQLERLNADYAKTGVDNKIKGIDLKIAELDNQKLSIRNEAYEYENFYDKMKNLYDFKLLNQNLNHYLKTFVEKNFMIENYNDFINELKNEIAKHLADLDNLELSIKKIIDERNEMADQLTQLTSGKKTYDAVLIKLKDELETLYFNCYHENLESSFLADLIDINDQNWRNAVEGYMNKQKTYLVVSPEIYDKVEKCYKKFKHNKKYRLSIINTKKMQNKNYKISPNSLSECITSEYHYVKNYINYLLGDVIKCDAVEKLKNFQTAITSDCHLYSGYVLSYINPFYYTHNALIGTRSMQIRIDTLDSEIKNKDKIISDMIETKKGLIGTQIKNLQINYPKIDILNYQDLDKQIKNINYQINQEKEYKVKITQEQEIDYETLIYSQKNKIKDIENDMIKQREQKNKKEFELEGLQCDLNILKDQIDELKSDIKDNIYLNDFELFIKENKDYVKAKLLVNDSIKQLENNLPHLSTLYKQAKDNYHNKFINSTFDRYKDNNDEYNERLQEIIMARLPEYEEQATERRNQTNIEFKQDFLYKIANRMEEAKNSIHEINKDIESISFGKDTYKFTARKPTKPPFSDFYDMLMDPGFKNRENVFGLDFDEKYSKMLSYMQITLEILNDPQSIDYKRRKDELDKLGDYRNYFEFSMIGRNENGIEEDLNKTQNKNSGGESQNPLYLALLTAFYQVFRMKHRDRERHLPLKLIILDEAFNKMDGNKVKSSIELIHKLGLQAIIAAPDYHLENYVEVVEKVFEFESENKQNIKIAEFERGDPLWESLSE